MQPYLFLRERQREFAICIHTRDLNGDNPRTLRYLGLAMSGELFDGPLPKNIMNGHVYAHGFTNSGGEASCQERVAAKLEKIGANAQVFQGDTRRCRPESVNLLL